MVELEETAERKHLLSLLPLKTRSVNVCKIMLVRLTCNKISSTERVHFLSAQLKVHGKTPKEKNQVGKAFGLAVFATSSKAECSEKNVQIKSKIVTEVWIGVNRCEQL